jgi:hypothetical protein
MIAHAVGLLLWLWLGPQGSEAPLSAAGRPFYDRTHPSRVFGQARSYRILLPPLYETSGRRYPVLYFFHGHSDRYTLEHYDGGSDFIPKMIDYVARHDLIVVSVDGYVARDYTGFYGGSPWDVHKEGGQYDFGAYFVELVEHVDATYRTLTDRRHRATSGLSMGGFMSLWLSARFPDRIGSASAFNPGPEFYAGDPGRRVLWRPKDHVSSHEHSRVRLVRASGDYISQYHEETRAAYARAGRVAFEYRVDEYHRHWITSIPETFDFHARAFADAALDNHPVAFDHADPYRRFEVWDYRVETTLDGPAITYLEEVTQGSLRVRTRRWAPDGPPAEGSIRFRTAPLYAAGRSYTVLDLDLRSGRTARREIAAGADGRLVLDIDGGGHQIGIAGPGTGGQPPVALPLSGGSPLRLSPGREERLPIRLFNPRGEPTGKVRVRLSTEYPTVEVTGQEAEIPSIPAGGVVDLADRLRVKATGGAGWFADVRLDLRLTYDEWHEKTDSFDARIVPEVLTPVSGVEVMDGRTLRLPVFRQRGNQGGGGAVEIAVTEGKGNGNGLLEPGEEATIWFRLLQGMDPFDKNTWRRAKVYSDSPHLVEIDDLEAGKQREWTGAMERTSLVRLAPSAPRGLEIPLLLDGESWSFHYTPDVRYGAERLYQAFQLHTRHLCRFVLKVP